MEKLKGRFSYDNEHSAVHFIRCLISLVLAEYTSVFKYPFYPFSWAKFIIAVVSFSSILFFSAAIPCILSTENPDQHYEVDCYLV